MGEPDTDLEQRMAAALAPFEDVRVAYLFGSRARGAARADSDLDLAVRVRRADAAGRAALILDLIAALTDALGALGERLDILDLDRAGSEVAFQVIREGRCVLCRDRAERVALEARIARRYDDERPYRALFVAAARRAAQRMGEPRRG
jgi:predicted nucleotidyltransferase